jgi:hypothetical protein
LKEKRLNTVIFALMKVEGLLVITRKTLVIQLSDEGSLSMK